MFKRFYERAGYHGTLQAFLQNKSFVAGMKKEPKRDQMLELICQFAICKMENGYFPSCREHWCGTCHKFEGCMGVPFCSKEEY